MSLRVDVTYAAPLEHEGSSLWEENSELTIMVIVRPNIIKT
jgi:hypothetical protein